MEHVYIAVISTSIVFIIWAHYKADKSASYLGTAKYGPLVSGISIVAAFTGGGALVNTTNLASKYGDWAFFDVVPAVAGLLLAGFLAVIGFFGRQFSRNFFDIKSEVYDQRAVAIHYAQIVLLYVLVMAAQLRAVATVSEQLDISPIVAVVFCITIVAMYAYRGFAAVTKTDLLQVAAMVPLYIIVGQMAFEPTNLPNPEITKTQEDMPISLLMALSLPFIFLPISQEVHQRGAAAAENKVVPQSYFIAAFLYLVLGTLLVMAFSRSPNFHFADIIVGENRFSATVITIGLFAAILSTLDTSTNVASHAVQKLKPFNRMTVGIAQVMLLIVGSLIFLYFPTVLSIILFALFLYMAGPALTFISVYAGIHPRRSAVIGGAFVSLQAFFHFKGGRLLDDAFIADILPVADAVAMGLILLALQFFVIVTMALIRRYG